MEHFSATGKRTGSDKTSESTSPRSMWLEDYFGEKRANSCIFGEDNENSVSRRDLSTVVRGQC